MSKQARTLLQLLDETIHVLDCRGVNELTSIGSDHIAGIVIEAGPNRAGSAHAMTLGCATCSQ